MKEVRCSFCKKIIKFDNNSIRTSGNAKFITCPKCKRSVWVECNGEKYYKEGKND